MRLLIGVLIVAVATVSAQAKSDPDTCALLAPALSSTAASMRSFQSGLEKLSSIQGGLASFDGNEREALAALEDRRAIAAKALNEFLVELEDAAYTFQVCARQ